MRFYINCGAVISAIILMCSCTSLDPYGFLGKGRNYTTQRKDYSQNFISDSADLGVMSLYVSTVEFPPAYDWRRDSAFGGVEATIRLYRDGVEVLNFKAGNEAEVSVSADMHHIVDGHIYTEYISDAQKVIKRDGEEILRVKGGEVLKGLLLLNEDVYTLSLLPSNSSLIYRKNDEVLYEVSSAIPLGDLYSNPLYPGGALYEDSGNIVFSYQKDDDLVIVEDGVPRNLNYIRQGSEVNDMRLYKGVDYVVCLENRRGPVLYEGHYYQKISDKLANNAYVLCPYGEGMRIWGPAVVKSGFYDTGLWDKSGLLDTYSGSNNILYSMQEDEIAYLSLERGKPSYVYTTAGGKREINSEAYFMSSSCALYHDGSMYVAYTPYNPEESPCVWVDGQIYSYGNINGYISCIAMGK